MTPTFFFALSPNFHITVCSFFLSHLLCCFFSWWQLSFISFQVSLPFFSKLQLSVCFFSSSHFSVLFLFLPETSDFNTLCIYYLSHFNLKTNQKKSRQIETFIPPQKQGTFCETWWIFFSSLYQVIPKLTEISEKYNFQQSEQERGTEKTTTGRLWYSSGATNLVITEPVSTKTKPLSPNYVEWVYWLCEWTLK